MVDTVSASSRVPDTAAVFQGDLYDDDTLRNPYPVYREIRDLGPAVWMPKRKMWAIARYNDVRAALRADSVLISGKGVAANDMMNGIKAPITLASDNEIHMRRRGVLMQPVAPTALKLLRSRLEVEAERIVAELATGHTFDAMERLASHLPVTIVAELVGLNEEARKSMLRWAAASFNLLGVLNERSEAAMPDVMELFNFSQEVDRTVLTPGGWADRLFDAADRGDLSIEEAKSMVMDYVGPALDTTILATGEMLCRLAVTPGAYAAVRADKDLIRGVVNESVRLGSPLRGFTRYAAADYEIGGTVIPEGSRVLILYASANHDERQFENPDVFDVRRNPNGHVGWGHGKHTCVGMHLARLEMEVLLTALVKQVEKIEVDTPEFAWNNVLQGFQALPARLYPVQ